MITLSILSNFVQELGKLYLRKYSRDVYKMSLYKMRLQDKVESSKLSIYMDGSKTSE